MMGSCRGCGRPMNRGIDPETGAKIPLDPVAPIYEIGALNNETNTFTVRRVRGTHAVTHFATCPKASEFSKGKRTSAEG